MDEVSTVIEWKKYPSVNGYYAELDGLNLTAWPNGAWAVYDPKGKRGSKSSTLANIIGPTGIEAAKQAAEKAANEMINGNR